MWYCSWIGQGTFQWLVSFLIGGFCPIGYFWLSNWISSSSPFGAAVLCQFFRWSIFAFSVCCFRLLPYFPAKCYFVFIYVLVAVSHFRNFRMFFRHFFRMSSSGCKSKIGDPVSIITSFLIPFTFIVVIVGHLFLSVILFIFSITKMIVTGWSNSSPIVVTSSAVTFRISCLLLSFCLHPLAKCPSLPQLLHNLFSAFLWWVPFGAFKKLRVFSLFF